MMTTSTKQRKKSVGISFVAYMEKMIVRLEAQNRLSTAHNYRASRRSLLLFLGRNDVSFNEVSSQMIEDYEVWLRKRSVSPNTSSFYMRNLRAVYNRAVQDELIDDARPFRRVYTGVGKTMKRAISLADIRRLKALDLSQRPRYELARDLFMFQFYAMGISFIDLAFLSKKNVHDDVISYCRAKTGQPISVPLNDLLRSLIKKYDCKSSPFLFPIMEQSDNPLAVRQQYLTTLHRINRTLKKLARLAGIKANLSTYVTRHSWATIAKQKGVPVATICEALGHDSLKTTQIYLGEIGVSHLAKANKLVLSGL